LKDNNNRVKLAALQAMEQMLPYLSNCLSNLTPFTIETIASNLSASNQSAKVAAAVLDGFMDRFGK
jgi:isoleucyl-tRNA synthetase